MFCAPVRSDGVARKSDPQKVGVRPIVVRLLHFFDSIPMAKSARAKKEKKKDFQKAKLKVGKGKPKASNVTDVSFKAKCKSRTNIST